MPRRMDGGSSGFCPHCQLSVEPHHKCTVLATQERLKRQVAAGSTGGGGGGGSDCSLDADTTSNGRSRSPPLRLGHSSSSSSSSSSGTQPQPPPSSHQHQQHQQHPSARRSPSPDAFSNVSSYFSLGGGESIISIPSSSNGGGGVRGEAAGSGAAAAEVPVMAAAAAAAAATAAVPQQAGRGADRGRSMVDGHYHGLCTVCGGTFERLVAHLSRGKCGRIDVGRALLARIRTKSPSGSGGGGGGGGGTASKPSVGRARTAAAAAAAAVSRPQLAAAGDGAGRFGEGGGWTRKEAKPKAWPCPVCAKSFQRVATHIMRSDCKAAIDSRPNATMACRRCGEVIGMALRPLQQHSLCCRVPTDSSSSNNNKNNDDDNTNTTATAASSSSAAAVTSSESSSSQLLSDPGGTVPAPQDSALSVSSSSSATGGGSACPQGSAAATASRKRPKIPGGGGGGSGGGSGSGGGTGRRRSSPTIGSGAGGAVPPPPRLKRRASAASNGSTQSGGGGGGGGGAVVRRVSNSSSTSSHHNADAYRRPSLAESAASGGSFTGGRALGSDDSDSDRGFDAAGGGGGGGSGGGPGNGAWFGAGGLGGLPGIGIIGAMRRPLPPKKRWETAFESWARGDGDATKGVGRDARLQSQSLAAVEADESTEAEARHPSLVRRARDSELVTVREVRKIGGQAPHAPGGGAKEETKAQEVGLTRFWSETGGPAEGKRLVPSPPTPTPTPPEGFRAVVVCRLVAGHGNERKKGDPAATAALGLEVADDASGAGHGDPFDGFPVIATVAAGGAADFAGVVVGAGLLKVEGQSMQGRSAAYATVAISNALCPQRPYSKYSSSKETAVRLVVATPVWSPAPAVAGGGGADNAGKASSGSGGDEGDAATAGSGCVGGMACLGREENKGQEFVELCWSVLMAPGGGVPPPTDGDLSAFEAGERPAQQEAEVARRLGFEVEKRELSQWLECIEVSSVTPGGVAAKHGLRTKDLVLALDGNHLLSTTQSSFWLDVGRSLRACDCVCQKKIATAPTPATAAAAAASTTIAPNLDGFPDDHEESSWLRFLIFRKGAAPAMPRLNGTPSSSGGRVIGKRPVERPAKGSAAPKRGKGTGMISSGVAAGKNEEVGWRRPRQHSRELTGAAGSNAAGSVAATGAGGGQAATAAAAGGAPPGDDTRRRKGGQQPQKQQRRFERDEKRKRLETRRRPAWWQTQRKGSHRTVLSLRPADAIPGAPRGGPVPPGAFLLEDTILGDKMTIPAGAKLVSVDGKATGHLDFQAARELALSAGINSVLVFE